MKKILLFNTAVMSMNQGDHIIMESVKRQLAPYLEDHFVVEAATHSPLFFPDQRNTAAHRQLQEFDLRFLCGTNLLAANRLHRQNTWNHRSCDAACSAGSVLVGVGRSQAAERVSGGYSRKFYEKVLSRDFIHSTRDEATAVMVRDMGFEAINTGCATMWGLTREHCAGIPAEKAEAVLFTVTDYAKDPEKDRQMLDILKRNYTQVYAWIQGSEDKDYLESLDPQRQVQMVAPSLESLNRFLDTTPCDYVGTRLHAGIKAMQKQKRSIIISIDNRARDMAQTYQLNTLDRQEIFRLEERIRENFVTDVRLDEQAIGKFLAQFDFLRNGNER